MLSAHKYNQNCSLALSLWQFISKNLCGDSQTLILICCIEKCFILEIHCHNPGSGEGSRKGRKQAINHEHL